MRALLFLMLLAPHVAEARCAPGGLKPAVLEKAPIFAGTGTGIVVAAVDSPGDHDLPDHDVAVQKGWHFRHGKKLADPTIVTIAPGLAVYQDPDGGYPTLENAKHTVVATARPAKDSPPDLAAPKVKKIVSTKVLDRRPTTDVAVTLDGDIPVGAVAIVAVIDGKPVSFGVVRQGEPLLIFHQHRCQLVPDGTVEPLAGQKVTVFWVDQRGLKSPASAPVTIAKGGTP